MFRLILLIAIVVVVFLIVKRLIRPSPASKAAASGSADAASAGAAEDKLVRCVQCGAFVRKQDALPDPRGFRCTNPDCVKSS